MTDLHEVIDDEEEDCESAIEGTTDGVKKRSMRRAINEYCKECTYDDAFKGGGTWRMQTEACTVTKCPLWDFRPVSKPRKLKEEE